jgi:hypothetical protein
MLRAIRQETLVHAGEVLRVICDQDAVLLRGRPQYVGSLRACDAHSRHRADLHIAAFD